ncbi:MAG: hypothetical protein ABIJ96_11125 [Elusimicrobiota bacterium]
MKITIALFVLTFTLTADDACAQGRKYSICLWPNTCTGKPNPIIKKPAAEKKDVEVKEVPKSDFSLGKDPLSQAVLNGRLTKDGEGIVSAIRISSETEKDKIIYNGKESLTLPASNLPAGKNGAKGAADDAEWTEVDSKTQAAEQINSMREERKSLQGAAFAAKTGADRMWGEKKKR